MDPLTTRPTPHTLDSGVALGCTPVPGPSQPVTPKASWVHGVLAPWEPGHRAHTHSPPAGQKENSIHHRPASPRPLHPCTGRSLPPARRGRPLSLQWTPGPRWGLGSAPRVLFHRSRGGWDVQSSPGFSPALPASCSSEQPLTPMSPGAAAAAGPDAPPMGGPRPLHFGCIKKQEEKQGFWDIPIHIGSGETCSPRQGTKKEASWGRTAVPATGGPGWAEAGR